VAYVLSMVDRRRHWHVSANTPGAVLSQEVDKHLYSPLHCAAVNGRAECLEALLARATPRQACATQWLRRTVLHLGALSGHAEVVAALLEAPGVNPNSEDGDGRSPLYAAAMVGSADCVALLLDAGCNTEKDDMHGQTPAFVAAEKGFVQVLKVRSGADLLLRDDIYLAGRHA
jgi:ankyrin repeat protein